MGDGLKISKIFQKNGGGFLFFRGEKGMLEDNIESVLFFVF